MSADSQRPVCQEPNQAVATQETSSEQINSANGQKPVHQKSNEEVTAKDVKALVGSPAEPGDKRPLIDKSVLEEDQPPVPIYKRLSLKAGVAGVIGLFVLIPLLGLFSQNLFSSNRTETVAVAEEDTTKTETEEDAEKHQMMEENAELKRELALQHQAFTAQDVEAEPTGEQPADTENLDTTTEFSADEAQQPKQFPVSKPVGSVRDRSAPAIQSTPARATGSRPAAAPVRLSNRPAISVVPQQQPQPEKRIDRVDLSAVAAAGNFGQLPNTTPLPQRRSRQSILVASTSSQMIPAVATAEESRISGRISGRIPVSVRTQSDASTASTQGKQRSRQRPVPRVMHNAEAIAIATTTKRAAPTETQTLAADADLTYDEQRALIMGEPKAPSTHHSDTHRSGPSLIVPGSSAQLEVTNAITWASDLPRALGSVTLTSPLMSSGAEAIPAGTELIVQIGELSRSGAVAMDVVAMVLPSGEANSISVPADAIAILELDGGYPIAEADQGSEQQLQAIDRQQSILGAIASVGAYLNRPDRETNVFGIGGVASSRDFGTGSVAGSILAGAANEMLRSRAARLDDEADSIMARPTIWSIQSGRALQLFVTQEIQL